MYSYMYLQSIELDQDAIASANKVSLFGAGYTMAREADSKLKRFAEHFPIHGDLTIIQVEFLVSRQAKWAELVTQAYDDIIRRRAAWITGMAPCRIRYNSEWHRKMKRFLYNTRKMLEEIAAFCEQFEKTA